MAVPWLRILDAVIGVTDLARSRRIRSLAQPDALQPPSATERGVGSVETRLAGVVVAALKEAFDRDTRRLELEREQLEAERRRAERALRLELVRQAAEREIGRQRLVAGMAVGGWIGTMVLSSRLIGSGAVPRVLMGGGWALLLAAVAASFSAQSRIARLVGQTLETTNPWDSLATASPGPAGKAAIWLVVSGLALAGIAALMVTK